MGKHILTEICYFLYYFFKLLGIEDRISDIVYNNNLLIKSYIRWKQKTPKKNTKKTNSNNDFDVIQYIKDDINNSSKSELEHMKSNGNYLLSIEDNPMIRKIINNQLELVENRLITIK